MKTFTYGTTHRAEAERGIEILVNEAMTFTFVHEIRGGTDWYLIKIKFPFVSMAEMFWQDFNRKAKARFALGYRR